MHEQWINHRYASDHNADLKSFHKLYFYEVVSREACVKNIKLALKYKIKYSQMLNKIISDIFFALLGIYYIAIKIHKTGSNDARY